MAEWQGHLQKMRTTAETTVQYGLPVGKETIPLNPCLGQRISLRFTGVIRCVYCGAKTKSSFNQGYCWTCSQTLAQCDLCIVKPEICHYDKGTCRQPEWGEAHCQISHTVYLANSSGLKVGITRTHQMQTRWMDQGAIQALPIAQVERRKDSGLIEVFLSQTLADKTNWRALLKGDAEPIDLLAERDKAHINWAAHLPGKRLSEEKPLTFNYPVLQYPVKIVSLNAEKTPLIEGQLQGIKGQYLLLDTGVINIRKYGGYEVLVTLA